MIIELEEGEDNDASTTNYGGQGPECEKELRHQTDGVSKDSG